jgi:hypothetical protein
MQVLVNGYWVILQVEDVYYDYRVSDSGYFFLCEGKGRLPISTPETGSSLVSQAKKDLAQRLGAPMEGIELLKIEEVTWRDGSLGCPQPGMFYTQALVNGSLIQLQYKATVYQYHSGRGGKPFLCENPPKDLDAVIAPGQEPPPGLSDQ